MAKKKITFESGMEELEQLVRLLESGELPLEESFKAYERANALKKALEEILEQGEKKIRLLQDDLTEVPFQEEE